jgi:hypothetical protein
MVDVLNEEGLVLHKHFVQAAETDAYQARVHSPVLWQLHALRFGEMTTQMGFDCVQLPQAELEMYQMLGRLVHRLGEIPCQR